MSIRYAVAEQRGIDEELVGKVHDYERSDLPERQKVALRLADAFILGMGRVPAPLGQAAAQQFSAAELVEIALLLFKTSQNKVRVALGVDAQEVRVRVIG
jgi:hypothetical protein